MNYSKVNRKIVIIGGNAAGPAAAAKAKRVDPLADVKMFEASDFISTGTCEIPFLFSGEIADYRNLVFFNEKSFYENKGVQVFTNHYVESIDKRDRKITVLNLHTQERSLYNYDKLILATGAVSKKIPNIEKDCTNIFYLKSIKDYLRIKNYLVENPIRNISIIGAGYIGLEIAEAFKKSGFNVTLLEIDRFPLPSAEPEIQRLFADLLKENEIDFIGNLKNIDYLYENKKIKSINTNYKSINTDMVIASIGVQPEVSLAYGAQLNVGQFGGLQVDNRMKTSDPNIYAAGDNVELKDHITKMNIYAPFANNAYKCGHIAGANAAGGNEIAPDIIINSALTIFGKAYSTIGLTQSNAEKNSGTVKSVSAVVPNLVKVMPNSSKVFGKIVYDPASKLLLGASFFGGKEVIELSSIVSVFIRNKLKIEQLGDIDFNYTPQLSPLVNILSILSKKTIRR